tara:strand:- start:436 stop:1278 length:843 start_codon:yes stop_codon:yes gene_type:complete
MSENYVWHYFLQICVAVDYLHKINVVHRDIKPDNVFIDKEYNIRLGDFGISKIVRPYLSCQTQVGTPLYMSPEIYKRERYDAKIDAWSVGCILYEMMSLRPPFMGANIVMLRAKVCRGSLEPCAGYSFDLHKITSLLLRTQARQRFGIADILKMSIVVDQMDKRHINQHHTHSIPQFHIPYTIPRRFEEWGRIIRQFCNVNNTIEMDDDVASNMKAIAHMRQDMEVCTRENLQTLEDELAQVTNSLQTAEKVVEAHRRRLREIKEKIKLCKRNCHKMFPL